MFVLSRFPMDFNPRPYRRGDLTAIREAGKEEISIHAPTGGATSGIILGPWFANFNPRPYRRGDSGGRVQNPGPAISIHAPTGGATPKGCPGGWNVNFNPRPYRRGDKIIIYIIIIKLFQSTPLQEGRQQRTKCKTHGLKTTQICEAIKKFNKISVKQQQVQKL